MISLRNLKIWNGHQSIPENSIDIEGSLISNIGTDLPVTQESIDCSGMTAIPGLIDAHVPSNSIQMTTRHQTNPILIYQV